MQAAALAQRRAPVSTSDTIVDALKTRHLRRLTQPRAEFLAQPRKENQFAAVVSFSRKPEGRIRRRAARRQPFGLTAAASKPRGLRFPEQAISAMVTDCRPGFVAKIRTPRRPACLMNSASKSEGVFASEFHVDGFPPNAAPLREWSAENQTIAREQDHVFSTPVSYDFVDEVRHAPPGTAGKRSRADLGHFINLAQAGHHAFADVRAGHFAVMLSVTSLTFVQADPR